MYRYRVDFSRLARTEDEIIKNKLVLDFLNDLMKKMGYSRLISQDYLPSGHILDSITVVEDSNEYSGIDILKKHVLNKYPEAKVQAWDRFND